MVWFWTREGRELHVETRYDNDAGEFVVRIVSPDGSHSTERFASGAAFDARLVELEKRLAGERWKQDGPPLIDPGGFPKRRPPKGGA